MVRTVRVRLELDRDDYKRGLRDAANETRGFDGEVRAAGKDAAVMGVEVKAAGTQVESMGREVDATAKKTASLGDEAAKTKQKTTGLGDESDKTKTKMVDLAKEITTTKTALAALGEEFRKTGQVNVDELGKLSRSLRELERAKAAIGKLIPGDSDKKKSGGGLLDFALDEWIGNLAKSTARGIQSGLGALSGTAPTGFMQWLIAGAVAAAPAIGAAINAGVLLGIGGGGLALGIIGAIQDPGVKAAWGDFGDFLKSGLADASRSFVAPMQAAAITARAALSQVFTGMRSGIDALAPSFTRVLDGLAQMVTRMDLGSAFASARPMVDALAQELPKLGDAMHSFFAEMGRGGPGAVQFFHDLMTFLDITIVWTGKLIEVLSKVYDWFRNNPIGEILTGPLLHAMSYLEKTGDTGKKAGEDVKAGAEDGATGLGEMAYAASQAAIKVDDLNSAIDKMVNQQLTAKSTHLAFNQSILDMKDAVAKNGRTLDDHTAAGIANEQALLRMAAAAEADRQSVLQQTQDVPKATAVFDDHMVQIYKTAAALGLNKAQVDALIGSIKVVPHDTEANIMLKNAGKTNDDIREINRGLSDLNGKQADTYTYNHIITLDDHREASRAKGGIDTYAHGGIQSFARAGIYQSMSGPGIVKFAEPETGGEAYIPRLGISQDRAMGLASKVGDWHGFNVVPRGTPAPGYAAFANSRPMVGGGGGGSATVINLDVTAGMGTDGYQVGRQIAEALRPFVQHNGGGSVQMAIMGRQVA